MRLYICGDDCFMGGIPLNVKNFLERQGFVIIATLDRSGSIHCSAKGIGCIEESGEIYIIDLYKGRTFQNLVDNSTVSIVAVDEYSFAGYTLKGEASIVDKKEMNKECLKQWDENVVKRISRRILRNLQQDKVSGSHPEARFPAPEYIIKIKIKEIVDLTPASLKSFNR